MQNEVPMSHNYFLIFVQNPDDRRKKKIQIKMKMRKGKKISIGGENNIGEKKGEEQRDELKRK